MTTYEIIVVYNYSSLPRSRDYYYKRGIVLVSATGNGDHARGIKASRITWMVHPSRCPTRLVQEIRTRLVPDGFEIL